MSNLSDLVELSDHENSQTVEPIENSSLEESNDDDIHEYETSADVTLCSTVPRFSQISAKRKSRSSIYRKPSKESW
ncbi:16846_t:CDS:2, partial [Cetraspora pellucida]